MAAPIYDKEADKNYSPHGDDMSGRSSADDMQTTAELRRAGNFEDLRTSNNRPESDSSGMKEAGSGLGSGGSDYGSSARKSYSSNDIQNREQSGGGEKSEDKTEAGEKEALGASGDSGGGKSGGWAMNIKNKKNKLKKGKAKVAGMAAGALGIGGFIIMGAGVLFLLGALKLPHFMENVTSWQTTRTSRAFSRSVSAINNEKLLLQTVEDGAIDGSEKGTFNSIKKKYGNLRSKTWGRFDKLRPEKVIENMNGEGKLKYKYGEPEGLLQRRPLKSVIIDGNEIEVPRNKRGHPFKNMANRKEFNAKLDANIEKALGDHKSLIRSKVANNIRQKIGFKKLSWWKKKAKDYKGTSAAEAERLNLKESYDNTEGVADDTKSGISDVDEQADEAKKQLDEDVKNPGVADDIIASGGEAPDNVKSKLATFAESLEGSWTKKAIGTASIIVGVGTPLCMIYAGSIENSGPLVDEQDQAVQRQYYQGATAADQLKAGDTTAEAAGAMGRKFGKISDSVPMNRSGGRTGNDLVSGQTSPQASAAGTFTIIDTLVGDNIFSKGLISTAEKACPVLTDMKAGAAIAFTELGLGVLSCVATACTVTAEMEAAGTVAKTTAKEAIVFMLKRAISVKTAKRAIIEGGAVAGLTFLAKYYVTSHMLSQFSGTSMNQEFAHQVDMGGNAHANELNRQMLYGRPMTNSEIAYDMDSNRELLAQKKRERSVYDRYFAIGQYDSLVSTLGMSIDTGSVGFGLLSRIANPFRNASLISDKLASMFRSKSLVFAEDTATASQQNYSQVQWGWSAEENNLIENDESYSPLENDYLLEQSGKKDKIETDFKPCFENTIGTILAGKKIQREEDGSVKNNTGDCSPAKLGINNPDHGDMVFRWRLSKMYENTLEHLGEIQEPAAETASGGASTGTGTSTGGSTIGTTLPEGTKEEMIAAITATNNVTNVNKLNTNLRLTTLKVLAVMSKKYKFTLTQGAHPDGTSVDIININGKGVPTGDDYAGISEDADNFVKDWATLLPAGAVWMGVPNNHYVTIGNEILKPKSGSANLDIPGTTRASGAHFHMGCAPALP